MSSGHENRNGTAAGEDPFGDPHGRRPDHPDPAHSPSSQEDDFHTSRNPVNWPIRVGLIPEAAAHLRQRALSEVLDEALSAFGHPAAHQVLSGESGVGKTQLAAHHARFLRAHPVPNQRPEVLLWADAATRDGVVFAYAQAARQIFARVPDDPELAAGQFLSWLHDPVDAEGRRWLVVWDDLTDPTEVEDLWPPADRERGRMIVTTRDPGSHLTRGAAHSATHGATHDSTRDPIRDPVRDLSHTLDLNGRRLVTIQEFSPAEADGYLRASLREAGIEHTDDELRSLAAALGRLPLALAQATAHMTDRQLSPTAYLELFHRRTAALAESFPRWATRSPVAVTWELAVERADAHHPEGVARPLMGLIALLDSTATPEQVAVSRPVRNYLGRRTFPARTLTRHEVRLALASLERLELVSRDTPLVIGAHHLTQRAALEHTRTRPTREAVRAIADGLVDVWPDTARDSALGRRLRSNTAVLRERTDGRVRVWSWLWEEGIHPVLFRADRGLDSSRQMEWAVTYWEVLAEAVAHTLDPDHTGRPHHPRHPQHPYDSGRFGHPGRPEAPVGPGPDPGPDPSTDPLAYWSGATADLAQAQRSFEELYERQLRVLGPDHLDTLRTRHGLAYLRSRAGDTTGAIVRYRNLLADLERVVGPDRVETLSTRGNLAVCRAESGDLTAAVLSSQELLADQREHLGPDHPNTLNTLHNLAHWRGVAGDAEGAVSELRELVTVQEEVLGPDHPSTLTSRHNLAYWQARAHDTTGAVHALEALVEDRRRVQGPEHPDTLTSQRQLERLRRESRARARADPSGRPRDDSGARESQAGTNGGNGGNGGSHEVDPNDEPTGPQALNQSWG